MNSKIPNFYTFHSEGTLMRMMSYSTIGIIIIAGISCIFLWNVKSGIFGLTLILLGFLWLFQGLYKITIADNFIIVSRKFSSHQFDFNQIEQIYKNREGFAPIYIYVIKYRNKKNKLKKITFDASETHFKLAMKNILDKRPDINVFTKE